MAKKILKKAKAKSAKPSSNVKKLKPDPNYVKALGGNGSAAKA